MFVEIQETCQFWNIKDESLKISNPDSLGVKIFHLLWPCYKSAVKMLIPKKSGVNLEFNSGAR